MNDIIDLLRSSILGLEILTAIIAFCTYKKYKHTILKVFPFFMLIVIFMETLSTILFHSNIDNRWVYNILGLVEYSFAFLIYYKLSKLKVRRNIIIILSSLFYFIFVLNMIFFEKSFLVYNNLAFTIGALIISGIICIFFHEVFNSEQVLSLRYMLITWISIGLLFYYIVSIPLTSVTNSLKSIIGDNAQYLIVFQIGPAIVMYLSFILGLIWTKKEYNY